jgi:hypothetical protein
MAKRLTSVTAKEVADNLKPTLEKLFEAVLEVSVSQISYVDKNAITLDKVIIKKQADDNSWRLTGYFYVGLSVGLALGLLLGWGLCRAVANEKQTLSFVANPAAVKPKHKLPTAPPMLFN